MRFTTTFRHAYCRSAALALFTLLLAFATDARAVTIPWSYVGNPGNGGIPYAYNIGTYEVTNTQYAGFLNAVAMTDTFSLYNFNMSSNINGGITQSGSPGSYSYNVKSGYANLPVNYVTWLDAARFANWLSNGQPNGAQNASTTENGSYYLNGAVTADDLGTLTRSSGATIVIPTENEWVKAGYYNPATNSYFKYPTSSNTTPSNSFIDAGNNANFYNNGYTTSSPNLTDVGHFATSASPYGTFDQGGNVFEWNETLKGNYAGWRRGARGGSFVSAESYLWDGPALDFHPLPTSYSNDLGFRVASLSVPEPSSFVLAAFGLLGLLACGWRRQKR